MPELADAPVSDVTREQPLSCHSSVILTEILVNDPGNGDTPYMIHTPGSGLVV